MKSGTKVTITNAGLKHFNLSGEVISVNEAEKRAQVNLDVFGTWGFNYTDIQATGSPNKPTETTKPKETGIVSTEKIKSVKTTKNKTKEIKITKRGPYKPRKPKTI